MTTDPATPGYSHTQKAPLYSILYGSALLCFALGWAVGDTPGMYIAIAVGLLIVLLAPLLIVLPLVHRTVWSDEIEKVEVGRTLLLDGWGIHYSIRGGWVWNLWGRDCVVLHLKRGRVLRVGTDDVENLAHFLKGKITPERKSPWLLHRFIHLCLELGRRWHRNKE